MKEWRYWYDNKVLKIYIGKILMMSNKKYMYSMEVIKIN